MALPEGDDSASEEQKFVPGQGVWRGGRPAVFLRYYRAGTAVVRLDDRPNPVVVRVSSLTADPRFANPSSK